MALASPLYWIKAFCEAKVAESALAGARVIEEVCWLDITVNDVESMCLCEAIEEAGHVLTNVVDI